MRLVAAFFVVPPVLACLTFVTSVVLVYAGAIEGAEPVDAALAIATGIGILAVVVTAFGAIPVVAWLIRRGPLSLRQLLLAGAALGNAPFAVIVLVVTITHLHSEPRFGEIGRYWDGLSGALVRIGIGLLCGTTSAAVFWAVGIRGSDLERVAAAGEPQPVARLAGMRNMMRLVGAILSLLFSCAGLCAAQAAWQPSPGHTQVPIWPGSAPGAQGDAGSEENAVTVISDAGEAKLVAGKPWTAVLNVSRPTMTVYSPEGENTGTAVVVFPGGGYNILAIDLEGTEVCDWLTSRGITCVLLKYRVPCVKSGPYRDCPTALEDAQRTVGLLRFQAAQWHIDPHRIGVLGFSAGGHMVAAMSTHFEKRLYPAVDPGDKESCRPDFAVALYPGHLAVPEKDFALNPDIRVTSRTPPTFLLQAKDDPVDPVEDSLVYYAALMKAGVPAEMHLYVKGRACLWTAAHGVSHHGMASARGAVARDDRDDSKIDLARKDGSTLIHSGKYGDYHWLASHSRRRIADLRVNAPMRFKGSLISSGTCSPTAHSSR